MYKINAPAVYAHDTVMANPKYRACVERVVAALEEPRYIVTFTDDQIPDLINNASIYKNRVAMGTLEKVDDPILLFNTFRFDDHATARSRIKALADQGVSEGQAMSLLGEDAFNWARYNLEGDPSRFDKVCRPCWRIHMERGCLHKCKYCGYGGLLEVCVNIDEYTKHLAQIMETHPWQETFLLDDDGDPPGLEPELGCTAELMEWFGSLEGKYLVIHTKTWNTEWIRDVKHNGNTIMLWSLSGPTQSRQIEPNAGTTEQRIEAARIAQEAGCPVRFKYKPFIPVRNWREEAAYTTKLLFEKTKPDVISLCAYMWMDVDEMKKRLPVDLLDPVYLQAAEDSREETKDTRTRPFPDWVRQEVYEFIYNEIRKYDKDVPVSLSTESFTMWKKLQDKLGLTATNYVCGCGPNSPPGRKVLACHPFKVAVRQDNGIPGAWPLLGYCRRGSHATHPRDKHRDRRRGSHRC